MEEDLRNLIKKFIEQQKTGMASPLLVVLGPTASGKTALSIEIAQQFGGEIISADSRQVYRHMNIGTDKISVEARHGVPHHLLDVADPDERFTVADFKAQAEMAIDDILARGKLPILTGGTGLYIRAITENFDIPAENREVRAQLIEELEKIGPDALYEKLKKLDPGSAAKIHPKNPRYVVRALEICMTTGHPKSDAKKTPKYQCLQIGLSWPREALFERIHRRIDEQIEHGLIDETKQLLSLGYSKNLPSMNTLGYKEIVAHLDGMMTLAEATEELKQNTRNFAKRQMTWFKRDQGVIWIKAN
ncbi:tRNA (adenosine(37)-N6)-dimethylallyltransferase MiaA [Candidatus Peregrinibacteria bacterium]|nr:tRNA (adenosine(37)-N6)-dimethylallyltransferase MiaA [Candidatus Peregrinibacteria bacterium]